MLSEKKYMYNDMVKKIWRFVRPVENVKLVVLGHQKSGTTAVAVLLSKAIGLNVSIDPLFHVDQGKAKEVEKLINNPKSIRWLCLRYPNLFGCEIVKDPDLIFVYKQIRSHYRNASYLFIVRDPRSTIRSICNRLGLDGDAQNYCPEVSEMEGGNNHWELILSGNLPKQGLKVDRSDFIYNLASRWKLAAEIYLKNSDKMTLLRYEDFLLEKEKSIKSIALELEFECKNSITEYVDVQYQPKGDAQLDALSFFGKENLKIIEDVCAKSMKVFGYDFLL